MKGRIIVAGALAQQPFGGGGCAWAFLQYVMGFRKLGFETYYVEQIAPDKCFDEAWQPTQFQHSANVRFFREVMAQSGFSSHCSLLLADGSDAVGLTRQALEDIAHETDLFVNLSGRFHIRSILNATRRRAYVDIDPGFVQIWQEQYGVDMNLGGHDVHFTVGLNLGAPDCPFPTCGIDWKTTLPPVVLNEWHTTQTAGERYTTVADWRGYAEVEWKGLWYGQKAQEFLKLIDLPRRVDVPLELCLGIHPDEADRASLIENGWLLREPRIEAATLDSYRNYLLASRGEFTAVKNGYVAGRSGWVSDRSACYLAAGRPVIVQETQIGAYLPIGTGLVTFSNVEEAALALRDVERRYDEHAAAAAELARTHLDSDRVLGRMVEVAGC